MTMLTEKDIYDTADILLALHGELAEEKAQALLFEALQKDDLKIAATWQSVCHAIHQLTLKKQQGVLH